VYKRIILLQIAFFTLLTCGAQIVPTSKIELQIHDSLSAYSITYISDDQIVEGYIIQPKRLHNTPIVLFNRGGNRNFDKLDTTSIKDWMVPIALGGFTVFATQYRTNEEYGGADLNDVLDLITLAKQFPNVDSNKIGMVGWSRGGLMTYLTLTKTSEIDCAIIGGSPTDMHVLIQQRPKMDSLFAKLIPAYSTNRQAELTNRSPVLWAGKLSKTKLLIIHGQADDRANVNHAIKMSEELNRISYPHQLLIFPEGTHTISNKKVERDSAIINWLTTNLIER